MVDALGYSTRYLRDEFGLITEEIDAAGNRYRREYNDAGQVIRETDCSGQTTRYRYHPLGWLSCVTAADGETRYYYDAAGRQMERAEGWEERLEWSERGLPVAYASADGNARIRLRPVRQTDSLAQRAGRKVQRRWDSRGRLISLQNQNGESYHFEWGADSLLLAQIGLDGVATRYDYDATGRAVAALSPPVTRRPLRTASPSARQGNSARITPECQTRYDYTGGPAGKRGAASAAGENQWSREAEQAITFAYDKAGRVIAEQGDQGSGVAVRRAGQLHCADVAGWPPAETVVLRQRPSAEHRAG